MPEEYRIYIEWIGYLGSFIIVISMMMSSIVKLRWYNLLGATIFAAYGFIIGAMPVALLNLCISIINIYHLKKLYNQKYYFKLFPLGKENPFLQFFLEYYLDDIKKFFPEFYEKYQSNQFDNAETLYFLISKNATVVGIFMGSRAKDEELYVHLDFVIPEYRDLKAGQFLYKQNLNYFDHLGVKKLIAHPMNVKHHSYLKKMGFIEQIQENKKVILVKDLSSFSPS